MTIALKDVARHAHVSVATASLALQDDPRVAEATRLRVRSAAESLAYVPSNLGRALRARKSSLIGFIIPTATSSFYDELLEGVSEVATAAGYGLLVAVTGESPEAERAHLRLFREKRADGVIVSFCTPEGLPELRRHAESGAPVVVCDFALPGTPFPEVRVDDVRATRMAAAHLFDLGHRRLAYAFCVNENARSRLAACRAEAAARGAPRPVACATPEDLAAAFEGPRRVTGVLAYSDRHAVQVRHVAAELGLRVPQDVSVVGFDDVFFAAWPELDLTTVRQPRKEIGREAARFVIAAIAGKEHEPRPLEGQLVVRGSTGPAPGPTEKLRS
jgi:DNA-binding LacI/PurR family transcriptional regulator